MVKAVILFLCVMALIGMVGRALFPGGRRVDFSAKNQGKDAKFCVDCGRPRIGRGPCGCKG
jgi:hypothetical protein